MLILSQNKEETIKPEFFAKMKWSIFYLTKMVMDNFLKLEQVEGTNCEHP